MTLRRGSALEYVLKKRPRPPGTGDKLECGEQLALLKPSKNLSGREVSSVWGGATGEPCSYHPLALGPHHLSQRPPCAEEWGRGALREGVVLTTAHPDSRKL